MLQHRLSIPPQRLPRWLDGFAQRHGSPTIAVEPGHLTLSAPNGAEAEVELIWGRWAPAIRSASYSSR